MNSRDTQKLIKAGYRFIRTDNHNKTIKVQSRTDLSHGWKILERFKTGAEMMVRMKELLNDDKTIEL